MLLKAICLCAVVGTALALPTEGPVFPTPVASAGNEYKSLQTVFQRLINTVITRDTEQLTPKLKLLLQSEMSPNQTQELVVDILNGVKEELQAAKAELAEEIEAAMSMGDEAAQALLTSELEVLERVVKKTYIAVRMALSVSAEILTKMTDKFKPLLASILKANQKVTEGDGA